MRLRKGQTAMEYLMTYGWAILVIMCVLAVLFYLGILNPSGMTPTICTIKPGFTCITWKLYTNGTLFLKIGQGTGTVINVTGMNCTTDANVLEAGKSIIFENNRVIQMTSATDQNFYVNCTGDSGGNLAQSGVAGDVYHGMIYINYTETESRVQRLAIGSITMKYEV
jgi:hypothetical protein